MPTGELRPVAGTPFDFREPHAIGARLGQVPGGYDHNWVLRRRTGLRPVATVYEPTIGPHLGGDAPPSPACSSTPATSSMAR